MGDGYNFQQLKKHILPLIQIGSQMRVKIDRVRTRRKRAVIVIRIKHLRRQRLPPARRSAI